MPRQARLDFEGCFHHVINRGMERREIFRDAQDYVNFRNCLERFTAENGIRCYGWALMPNHFHLVVKTGKAPLSRFMSRLQTSYAGTFNRRHRRTGKLFQNRYKSIVCDEDVYFKELVAYVHLNPLRAKMVESLKGLERYLWSGHRAILGKEKAAWQDVDGVLKEFGGNPGEARRRYMAFLEERRGGKAVSFSSGGLERSRGGVGLCLSTREGGNEDYNTRIMGDEAFIQRVEKAAGPIERPLKRRGSLKDLMKAVAAREGVPFEEVTAPGKTTGRGSRARSVISYLAAIILGERKNVVADGLNVTPLAVTKLCRKGAEIVGEKGEAILGELSIV